MKSLLGRVGAVLLLAGCAGSGAHLWAQAAPYAMFSAGHYSGLGVGTGTAPTQSGGITSLGGTFGFYDDITPPAPVHVGFDARVVVQNSANSTPYGNKLTAGMFGMRVDGSGLPLVPVDPYVQVEIGAAGTNNGTSYTRTTSFVYQFQFGADFALLIPHLEGRVEYGAGQLTDTGNTNHTLQTFGAGLVLRLPGSSGPRRCCRR